MHINQSPAETIETELNKETPMSVKADQIQDCILKIFEIQERLQQEAPDFNWKGLGNLLGDYGEYLAIKHFELSPTTRGLANADATMSDDTTVQIKTCLHSERIGFRGTAGKLLVLKIDGKSGDFDAIYNGNFPDGLAGRSERDSKYVISLAQLLKMRDTVKDPIPRRAVPAYPVKEGSGEQ
jgi:hypothetical protein